MRQNLYRGYSSFEYERTGSFTVKDIELVKLDLLNHIFTRRGSRVRMPRYGTTIPDMPFEMIDEDLLEDLHAQLTEVFEYDPRVQLLQLQVIPYYDINTVMASATLRYIEFDVVDVLNLDFNESTIG
ncbi:Lysozyme [compost metagenome]